MKRIFFILFILLPCFIQAKTDSQNIGKQLLNNIQGGVEINNVNGRTSYYVYAGTGYKYYFYKQMYLFPQINFKWGQYRHDPDNKNNYTETTSIALPLTVGYDVFQKNSININLYAGIRYEQILYTSFNSYSSKVNSSQIGLLGGASIQLSPHFGLTVSYYYGLTSLYQDGTGKTSSFNFAFLF
jgi:hypothetical protein